MLLKQLIDQVKKEKPSNLSADYLTRKTNEVEAIVQEYLEVPIGERVSYVWPEDADKELKARDPYSRIYPAYLKACIDYTNEELESYVNNMAQFESDYAEFENFAASHGLVPQTAPMKIVGWW